MKRWNVKPALILVAAACAAAGSVSAPLAPATREAMPNGVVIWLLPRRDLPLIDLRVVVRGGAESDPEGKAGLALMTADLLERGGAGAQFVDRLDGIGATLDGSVDAQSSAISMQVLSRFAAAGLNLLAEAVLDPAFTQTGVDEAIAQAIDASRHIKDSPGSAAWEYFNAFFFGPGHPYGRPQGGDEISLRGITRADIRDYYRRTYVGPNLIVVAAGDFDPAWMRERLVEAFGRVPAGAAYRWLPDRAPSEGSDSRLLLVDQPDATETWLLVGFPGIRRASPDRAAVWLVNTILGGCFTSLLNEALRVEGGLTYDASSQLDQSHLTGAITVSTATSTETTGRAIDLTLAVLSRLRERGVTAEQLASMKSYLKGVYPAENLQTGEQLVALLAELELQGLDRRDVDEFFVQLDAVTLEQANAAVRKYFAPAGLRFVLVGDAGRIRGVADKYAAQMAEVSLTEPGFGAFSAGAVSPVARASRPKR